MKTLVIHPKDSSTDFLQSVYENIPDKTVIRSGRVEQVKEEIEKHRRIIMLGHGTPSGLLAVGSFSEAFDCNMTPGRKSMTYPLYVINRYTVELLKKKQCIFIWCNADKFVTEHDLKGLYSGMFISEVYEAKACGITATQKEVDSSNDTFAEIIGTAINRSLNEMYKYLMPRYGKLVDTNPVAEYNYRRLYLKS